jgi:outer membrane protein assembly factor BamB
LCWSFRWPRRPPPGAAHQGWNSSETQITPTTAATLTPAWTRPIEASGYSVNTGSPIIVGSTVVVGGGAVTARDVATGTQLWSRRLSGVVITTPAWAGNTIIVTEVPAVGSDFSGVAALDAATGAVKWERRLDGAGNTSPSVVGTSVLVSYGTVTVARLRLSNGRPVWTAALPPGGVSSPTSDGVRVYVSDSGGTEVTALDIHRGAVLWRRLLPGTEGGTTDGFAPASINGNLYAPFTENGVVALDAATGKVLWHTQIGETFWWGLSTDGSRVIGVSNDTHVVALAASTGQQLWTREVGGIARTAALAGGVALLSDQSAAGINQVELLDAATGTELGSVALRTVAEPDPTTSPMPVAVSNGRVAVPDWDRLVVLTLPAS